MLQNSRVTAFAISELLRKNQHGDGGGEFPPTPLHTDTPRLRLTNDSRQHYPF